mmetsp:Transcript_53184/g.142229  ORF Transcript_53184/g.142229 Transcript_53184/m.142229 type:complete len:217 (-) Transcript_53184:637-1287(-)
MRSSNARSSSGTAPRRRTRSLNARTSSSAGPCARAKDATLSSNGLISSTMEPMRLTRSSTNPTRSPSSANPPSLFILSSSMLTRSSKDRMSSGVDDLMRPRDCTLSSNACISSIVGALTRKSPCSRSSNPRTSSGKRLTRRTRSSSKTTRSPSSPTRPPPLFRLHCSSVAATLSLRSLSSSAVGPRACCKECTCSLRPRSSPSQESNSESFVKARL